MATQHPAGGPVPPIVLSDMAQRREMRTVAEDWTGTTNSAERRKLQNRINQRAYYERKKVSRRQPAAETPNNRTVPYRGRPPIMYAPDAAEVLTDPRDWRIMTHLTDDCRPESGCSLLRPGAQGALRLFAKKAYEDYVLGCPQPWYLSTLIQVNVFNALVSNGFAIGFSDQWQREGAISPFTRNGPEQFSTESYPPNLQPTALQRTVSHHPWVDLFPIPR